LRSLRERKQNLNGTSGEKTRNFEGVQVYVTQEERLKKRMKIRHIPSLLNQNHSLQSLNSTVIARYHDRPLKLRNHLPFAVDYKNNSLQQPASDIQRPHTATTHLNNFTTNPISSSDSPSNKKPLRGTSAAQLPPFAAMGDDTTLDNTGSNE